MRPPLRLLVGILITCAALTGTAHANPLSLSFDGTFAGGPSPWWNAKGQVQCANYGTASQSPRLRGDLYIDSTNPVSGGASGHFYLPADTNTSTYPWEACDLTMGQIPNVLPDDEYYGLMVYVPAGWTIANHFFGGVNIYELHFQAIWGAPITLELHPDHVTLAVQTGGCNPVGSTGPGCQYRSNADSSCQNWYWWTCLPGEYAIPPGAFVQGKWNEILIHARWASDTSGAVQTWYRVLGSTLWTPSASVSGIPTVQWNRSTGFLPRIYTNEIEAYTQHLTSPLDLWLDDQLISTSSAAVMTAMP
ncbi:MAG TPA: hypothetical protein VKT31_01900 [Solirubrobacteraceae bacterium]|nr:hypothetical protein [Solirubrobacteraceae bacterium]